MAAKETLAAVMATAMAMATATGDTTTAAAATVTAMAVMVAGILALQFSIKVRKANHQIEI